MNVELGELIEGPFAHARQVIVRTVDIPDQAAVLNTYFITAPWQSPAWVHYRLSVVHLRAVEHETQPVTLRREGATHEFLLVALDPKANPVEHDPSTWHSLYPLNLEYQIRMESDENAAELCTLAARAVCNGLLWAEPPMSGQTEPWVSTLEATAAHYRGEHEHE